MKSHLKGTPSMKLLAFRSLPFVTLILLASDAAFAHRIVGKVVAVSDGDTISLQEAGIFHRVRLNGVDAPELDQEFGQESKQKLSDMLLGNLVVVVWNKTVDRNRLLGTVIVGSMDVGLEQIRAGLAWYFRRYDSDIPEVERALYSVAEDIAKDRKLGLWGRRSPIAPWDWRAQKEPPAAEGPKPDPAPASVPVPEPAASTRSRTVTPEPSATASRQAYSVQCAATTKRGYRCKRMTRNSNGYCWQHGGN
jgi:endonuclease YncB( thermonuclease family)